MCRYSSIGTTLGVIWVVVLPEYFNQQRTQNYFEKKPLKEYGTKIVSRDLIKT